MNKRIVLLSAILSASILLCACRIEKIRREETTGAPESTTTVRTTESQKEKTVSPTPKPTAKPTPKPTTTPRPTSPPTLTPSPTPETVYIPPETLPDGQLFEDNYYLILPGEGAIYNVFDCKGEIVKTYHAMAERQIGLFEKDEAERIILNADSRAWNPYEYNHLTGEYIYKEEFPGGYIQSGNSDGNEIFRIVTEKETIRLIKEDDDTFPNSYGTTPLSDRTAVCVVLSHYVETGVTHYFYDVFYAEIKKDGTVISRLMLEDLPGTPVQLLGDDRVIIEKIELNQSISWNLTDLSGNVLLEYVQPIRLDYVAGVSFYDYYLKNRIAYDANMNPVPDETMSADGRMIPGVTYYVEGIPCSILNEENYNGVEFFEWMTIDVAPGRDDDNLAIKTEWGDCVIHGTKAAVMDVNSSFVLLDDLSVYSFETGEYLFDASVEDMNFDPPYCTLAEDYIIVRYYSDNNNYGHSYVIDKYGNLRYFSEKNYIEATGGPYLFLQRGPYVGLADLNGDWILKTLDWELTSDGIVFWRYWN